MVKLSQGNKKLGKIPNWSLPAGESCPGASEECAVWCYAKKGQMGMVHKRGIYHNNWDAAERGDFIEEMVAAIRATKKKVFRIHVSGDFYSDAYIQKWEAIIMMMEDIKFFAYTRSWMVPELVPGLERLRALPNMQLFASVDESMPMPPEGWRVCYVDTDKRFRGGKCPEQMRPRPIINGKAVQCDNCTYCWRKERGNLELQIH